AATPAPAVCRPAPTGPGRAGPATYHCPLHRSSEAPEPCVSFPPHLFRSAAGFALTGPASLVPFLSLVKTPCQRPHFSAFSHMHIWGGPYPPSRRNGGNKMADPEVKAL
ncbi:mCG146332, partial [Mus musculus]